MISSEVQRTLVKSPPELWAEISDPEALARHLGGFGEIRITRVQPEQKVEWEADDASGSIVIKPSGWGTKVKLTVTRELSDAEGEVEVELSDELEAAAEGESLAEDGLEQPEEPDPASQLLAEHEHAGDALPAPADESDPQPERESEPAPERRPGFFARLFGHRRAARTAAAESELHTPEIADDSSAPTLVSEQASGPGEAPIPAGDPAIDAETELDTELDPDAPGAEMDVAAELEQAEEAATEQVTAVLTGVLDRLGAAHHRPFSRA